MKVYERYLDECFLMPDPPTSPTDPTPPLDPTGDDDDDDDTVGDGGGTIIP